MISSKISIHVPSWGTTDYRHTGSKDRKNFNPRSLVGNDKTRPRDRLQLLNFNPRSLVGNDSLETCIYCPIADFNPRSLVGNDFLANSLSPVITISIHVPSWGTTANFHKYSLFFYAINIIFLLFIIPSLFSLVLFMLLF